MCYSDTSDSTENNHLGLLYDRTTDTRTRPTDSAVIDSVKYTVDASGVFGFWGHPEPPSALSGGDRSISEYCNSLFGNASDKGNAALVDEFGDLFGDAPIVSFEPEPIESKTVDIEPLVQPVRRFIIPMIPSAVNQNNITHSITNRSNVVKTKQEMKKLYRKNVAIPRYLKKRANRKWDKELMHPSRSVAAQRRPRVGGQFGVVDARFTPC